MDKKTFVRIAERSTRQMLELGNASKDWSKVSEQYRCGFVAGLQAAAQILTNVTRNEDDTPAIGVGLFLSAQEQLAVVFDELAGRRTGAADVLRPALEPESLGVKR
ncbi:MAG: hypothetical protein Q8R28_19320 [Dehalococcoidia bacterium]|nr:hypothetical protein [Dehalococcoidia bacterium]